VRIEARQSAIARYGRVGFEAAAVSAMGVLAGAAMSPKRVRVATLRFAHPYAVVAVAQPPLADPPSFGPWDGLPVFSAWVTKVEEPRD
jgi:hypothetical protein